MPSTTRTTGATLVLGVPRDRGRTDKRESVRKRARMHTEGAPTEFRGQERAGQDVKCRGQKTKADAGPNREAPAEIAVGDAEGRASRDATSQHACVIGPHRPSSSFPARCCARDRCFRAWPCARRRRTRTQSHAYALTSLVRPLYVPSLDSLHSCKCCPPSLADNVTQPGYPAGGASPTRAPQAPSSRRPGTQAL